MGRPNSSLHHSNIYWRYVCPGSLKYSNQKSAREKQKKRGNDQSVLKNTTTPDLHYSFFRSMYCRDDSISTLLISFFSMAYDLSYHLSKLFLFIFICIPFASCNLIWMTICSTVNMLYSKFISWVVNDGVGESSGSSTHIVEKSKRTSRRKCKPRRRKSRRERYLVFGNMIAVLLVLFIGPLFGIITHADASSISGTRGQKSPRSGDKRRNDRISSNTTGAARALNMQDVPARTTNNVTDVPDSNSQIDFNSQIDEIFGGWGNKKVIKCMKDYINQSIKCNGPIRSAAKKYLKGLLTCEDEDLLTTFEARQKELGDAINKLVKKAKVGKSKSKKKGGKKGKKKKKSGGTNISTLWQANFGEALSELTEGLVLANYAPSSDCKVQASKYCRQNRKNSCMIKFCRSLVNSLIKELEREKGVNIGVIEDEFGHAGVRLNEACSVVLGKDDYQGEVKAFVEDAGFRDEHEFYMLSLITMGYQIRYYRSINESRPLPILIATANGRDNLLEYNQINFHKDDGVFENDYVKLFKSVAHGECWSNKVYLLGFEEKDYDQFGQALVGFYSCFDDFRQLSALGGESRIAYRYSGLDFMTEEEREELVRNREYFYRGKTLAKALESVGWDKRRLSELSNGKEILELYTRLLGDGKSAKEETEFVQTLKDGRFRLLDTTSAPTLAKALGNVGWDKKRLSELSNGKEMFELYTRLLGDGKSAKEETEFVEKLKDGREIFLNTGFGKWFGDSYDILDKIFAAEEDVTIPTDDSASFNTMLHVYNAAVVLNAALDDKGVLPEASVPDAFEEINAALKEGTDDHHQESTDQRWRRFLTRFSDISGVDKLEAHRDRKIRERLQVSADNKVSTVLDNTEKVLSNTGQVTKSSKATELSADNLMS